MLKHILTLASTLLAAQASDRPDPSLLGIPVLEDMKGQQEDNKVAFEMEVMRNPAFGALLPQMISECLASICGKSKASETPDCDPRVHRILGERFPQLLDTSLRKWEGCPSISISAFEPVIPEMIWDCVASTSDCNPRMRQVLLDTCPCLFDVLKSRAANTKRVCFIGLSAASLPAAAGEYHSWSALQKKRVDYCEEAKPGCREAVDRYVASIDTVTDTVELARIRLSVVTFLYRYQETSPVSVTASQPSASSRDEL